MFADISDDLSNIQADNIDGLKMIVCACLAMLALSLLVTRYFPMPFDPSFPLGF